MRVEPFSFAVSQAEQDDLHCRLERTRWPNALDEGGWSLGTDPDYLTELVSYWRHDFNWRAVESRINSVPNYRATIDGFKLHFLHLAGRGPKPLPLMLCHGWPGSFVELLALASILADPASHGGDPEDAFSVVVPSLPGFGFSDAPGSDMDRFKIADLWVRLMRGLGYGRFGAHAYDISASTVSLAAMRHPECFVGYHTTEPGNPAPYLGPDAEPLSRSERDYLEFVQQWEAEEGGYMAIASTRPQTLAYGLNDSPAGLASWIVEKWWAWTDPTAKLDDRFSKDEILANVALYWFTGTIHSANRHYTLGRRVPWRPKSGDRITVPVGVTLTATQPIERPPREYVERMYADIRHWVQLPRGGHFITMEEPALFAEHLRAFFRPLRPCEGGSV